MSNLWLGSPRVCIWVTVRLICFRARAQRSGHRERREADYEYEHDYECDTYVESCNPELNQAKFILARPQIGQK